MSLSSPAYILKQVYHAIVAPYLNYCNLIWGGAANIHVDKLFRLQKRAIRVISNAVFWTISNQCLSKRIILTFTNSMNICAVSMYLKIAIGTKL